MTMIKMTALHLHYDSKAVLGKCDGRECKDNDGDTFQKLQMIMTLCCDAKFLLEV